MAPSKKGRKKGTAPSRRTPPRAPKSAVKRPVSSPPSVKDTASKQPKNPKLHYEVLPTPAKSSMDQNNYKLLKLRNNIKVLLIQQPTKPSQPSCCPRRKGAQGLIIDSELSTFPPSTFGSQSLTEKSEPRSFLLPSLTEPSSTKKSWKSSQFITNPSEVDRLIQACTEDGSTRDLGCGPSDPCQLGAEKAESEDEAVSVSLVIGVGSSQDYKHRSGLAHFCEHMVHHGCEKFKEEDSYFKYVMTKGYEFNAYTAATLTAYYFRVQGAHLEQGLDLLSNMMAEPTFEENMCKREVQAVDNEYMLKEHSDLEAYVLLLWSLAKNDHPLKMFSCGNFETLLIKDEKSKVQDLKKDLVNFHKENYVGSAMTFCIQGYDTLLNMEELVVKHLDVVPVGDKCLRKEMAIPSNHRDPYNTSEFKKMYIMEGNTLQMLIAWALPPEVGQDFKNNPFEFWGSLLEDEGTHGLPYLLRQRGLITDFSASIPDIDYWRNEYCTMFEVRLVLRKNVVLNCDGHKKEGNLFINLENIMETVYEYLGKLRQTSLKQRKAAWEEFSKTKNEYFDYSIPVEGVNYTTKCAVALQTLPDEAILTSERVVTEYNDQVMRGYLEQLTPSNMNVITILPREVVNTYAAELKKCDAAVEPYTKRKFWSKLIEVERLNKLLKNKATTPLLIPTNNPISSESQTQFACVHKIPPKLIALNAKCQVTHVGNFGDDWFIGNVNIHTFSSASVFRLNHTNLCKLYLLQSYLQQVVLPDASEIGRAGLQVSIDLVYDSLRIQLSGFPNNLPLALKKIMLHIFPNEESISQVAFDAAKESLLYGVSHSLGQGAFLINNLLDEAVTCDSPSFRNAINTICNVDFQTFVTFTRTFANSTFVWASLEGNMSAKNCEDIAIILSTLNYYPVISGWKNSTLLVKPERFALPLEKRCIRVKSEFRKEKNSVVRNCYQFATNLHQTHASVIVNFLGMCMRAPYFQILRTEEQVGYKLHILHFQNYLPYPCIFADAVFPAHKTTLCEVDAKIDNFFVKFWERNLKNMNDAEFRELKHLWGIPDDLNLQDVKTFYEHAFIQNGPTGKGIKVHVSKISVQVLGMDRENCEGFIKCKESNWAKPMKEKDQPISFCTDADDLCEGVHYFVRDIQWFRDGKFQ